MSKCLNWAGGWQNEGGVAGWLFDLRKGLENGMGVSLEGKCCFFKGSFDFLVEGAGGSGVNLGKAAQQVPLLCSSAGMKDRLFLGRN